MSGKIRKYLPTILIAFVAGMVGANSSAIAHGVHAAFAHNSDKVDGFHAVGAGAANKNEKLVATNASGNLSIKGNFTTTGLLRTGSRTGTTQAPLPGFGDLVVRPLLTLSTSQGNVIARTDLFRLERDGTENGITIAWAANSAPLAYGVQSASCVGVTEAGTFVGAHQPIGGEFEGSAQLIPTNSAWIQLECAFGQSNSETGYVTKILLIRSSDDNGFWAGQLISNFNQ